MHEYDEDARQRALDRETAGLSAELEPERDLWPGIAAALPGARQRRWPFMGSPLMAMAAAVTVIAFAGVLGVLLLHSDPGADTPPLAGTPMHELPAGILAAEAIYQQVRAERVAGLSSRLDELSPEQRASVEQSLATIEVALQDLRTALAEAPTDPLLQSLLLSVYSKELAVLGQLDKATRVAGNGSLDI